MNQKILKYANFLLDNDPSPFCDYIIRKELLDFDEKSIRYSYDWAKRFDLYTELQNEQLSDGSWGGLVDALSSIGAKRKIYKTTTAAVERIFDLALDMNDEMVAKLIEFLKKSILGEVIPLDIQEKTNNKTKQDRIMNVIHAHLYRFVPDDPLVAHIKREKEMSDDAQRSVLAYEWTRGPFDAVKIAEPIMPDEPPFVFWLVGLEKLMHFSLFGEFVESTVSPFLFSLCERLSDPEDKIPIYVNRYFGKRGQYSESWSKYESKKKDLLLRIIRILNKCY